MTDSIVNSKIMMEELSKPFNVEEIEWRVQTASNGRNGHRLLVLPYITSRAIMNRLDEVCGAFWQSNYEKITVDGKEAFQCRLSIKVGGEWITRTDASEVTDIESVKGGHSNALKRVGVQWGISRYLYELPKFWVELKDRGEHNVYGAFTVNKQSVFLKGYFDTPKLPDWAIPESNKNQVFKNQQRGTNQPQQAIQRNQETNQQSQQQSQQPPQDNQHVRSLNLVNQLLTSMQVPTDFVAPLFKETTGLSLPYNQAKVEDLGKFYHALIPIQTYVKGCESMDLDMERTLYYAQIVLKQGLKNKFSLVNKMTKEDCSKTLDLIREDLNLPIDTKQVV